MNLFFTSPISPWHPFNSLIKNVFIMCILKFWGKKLKYLNKNVPTKQNSGLSIQRSIRL